MPALNLIILLLYIFWGVVSFLAQGETPMKNKIRSFNFLYIIPNYRFFCPRPVRSDYHLEIRTRSPDLTWEEWKEIELGRRNRVFSFIWNPGNRDRKIFHKIVKQILKDSPKDIANRKNLLYKALVNYIRYVAGTDERLSIQLRIISKQDLRPDTEEKILYEGII